MCAKPFKIEFKEGKLAVTKIDAAVRQLETAITLWFFDGDPVSICTLSFAALEILRSLNNSLGGKTKSLMFDSESIKEEYREAYIATVRAEPNFLKHADRDPHGTIFLTVKNSEYVLLDAVRIYGGLNFGARPVFNVFVSWLAVSRPDLLTKPLAGFIPSNPAINSIISDGKKVYFNAALPIATRMLAGVTS